MDSPSAVSGPHIFSTMSRNSLSAHIARLLPFLAGIAVLTPAVGGDMALLRDRIDDVLVSDSPVEVAGSCSDADFIRRASLALTGCIASGEDCRAFLSDSAPDRRARLVDRLLASPARVRHFTEWLDTTLMERRPEKNGKVAVWRRYLFDAIASNTPWDELVRDLLTADGVDERTKPAARWLTEREVEPNLLTRDAGRIFLGMDMACAQCHNHPRVIDYAQRDYQGLFAFFSRSTLHQPDTKVPAAVAEAAAGDVSFRDVLAGVAGSTRPRLPGGPELVEPAVRAGDEWVVAPDPKDKKVRPVPRHSRRALLPDELSRHPAFRRNIANRVWALVMGRGLVEPLDFTHSDNPPANPRLLEMLGDEMAAMRFDLRGFARELVLTQCFQRAYDPPAGPSAVRTDREELVADQRRREEAAAGSQDRLARAREVYAETSHRVEDAEKGVTKAREALAAARKRADEAASKKVADAQAGMDAAAAAGKALAAAEAAAAGPRREAAAAFDELQAALPARQTDAIAARHAAQIVRTAGSVADWRTAWEKSPVRRKAAAWRDHATVFATAGQALLSAASRVPDVPVLAEAASSVTAMEGVAAEISSTLEATADRHDRALAEARQHFGEAAAAAFLAGRQAPLTPEQLCWSMLQATGQLAIHRASAAADLEKTAPFNEADRADTARVGARELEVEWKLMEKMKGNIDQFVRLFGGAAGQPQTEFFATADQALYFKNSGIPRGWITGSLIDRMAEPPDPAAVAALLFTEFYNRPSDAGECADVAAYLAGRPSAERSAAIQDIAWAMLTSSEFRFNH